MGATHPGAVGPAEHTGDFWRPLVFPLTSNCHLCAWQTFSPKPPESSTTGCNCPPYHLPPQKTSGPKPSPAHRGPSAMVPFPIPAEKETLPPHRWLQWSYLASLGIPPRPLQAWYLPTQRAMDTTTQPLPRLSSPIHFSPSLPRPSVLGSPLDSKPRHRAVSTPKEGPGPGSLLEPGPGKVLAPNTNGPGT